MIKNPPPPQKCVPQDLNLTFHLEVNLEDCARRGAAQGEARNNDDNNDDNNNNDDTNKI